MQYDIALLAQTIFISPHSSVSHLDETGPMELDTVYSRSVVSSTLWAVYRSHTHNTKYPTYNSNNGGREGVMYACMYTGSGLQDTGSGCL